MFNAHELETPGPWHRRDSLAQGPAIVTPTAASPVEWHAVNDADAGPSAIDAASLDAYARHALASNGFGDVVGAGALTSVELHRAVRRERALRIGDAIAEAFAASTAWVRAMGIRYRQIRSARATQVALSELDDHALRDLGFDRSEIGSIAAEWVGYSERTRVQMRWMSEAGPK